MNGSISLHSVYRRAAISFFVLTILLLFMVVYFVLPKAIIVVTPKQVPIERSYLLTIVSNADELRENELLGGVIKTEIVQEKTFNTTGTKTVAKNIAGDIAIVIKNNYSIDQPLVATTRFLTDDGILLRLREAAVVPAGGEVTVNVYPDNPEAIESGIQSGQLTIPGLWENIQDKIFGVIEEPIYGVPEEMAVVSANDVARAKDLLRSDIEKVGRDILKQKLSLSQDFDPGAVSSWNLQAVRIVDEQWTQNKEVDVPAENFKLSGRLLLEGVFYNLDDTAISIKNKVMADLPDNHEFVSFSEADASVSFADSDTIDPEIIILFKGYSRIKDVKALINQKDIIGLTPVEVINAFKNVDVIENIKIELSPFWVKKIPKNNVDIIVVQN